MMHPGERTRKAPRPPHALGSCLPSPVACEVCCWSGLLERARRKCTPDRAVAGGAVASVGPQDNRSYGDGPEVTLTSAHRLLADLAHGRSRARPGRDDRRPGEDPGEGPVQHRPGRLQGAAGRGPQAARLASAAARPPGILGHLIPRTPSPNRPSSTASASASASAAACAAARLSSARALTRGRRPRTSPRRPGRVAPPPRRPGRWPPAPAPARPGGRAPSRRTGLALGPAGPGC